jgi:hypothetical protein
MTSDASTSGDEILKEFIRIVLTSPVAVVTLVLAAFLVVCSPFLVQS